jgi:hypothetical protein
MQAKGMPAHERCSSDVAGMGDALELLIMDPCGNLLAAASRSASCGTDNASAIRART